MKTFIKLFLISLVVVPIIVFYSCEKYNSGTSGMGKAEFSISLPGIAVSRSATSSDSVSISYQIVISVEDLSGNAVLTDELILLHKLGTGYVSENIKIRTGEFRLTRFMVIDPAESVVYAAPKAESSLACLCTQPLPLNFNIIQNQVTRIMPEVLAVGNLAPDQFGYTSFGVKIINPLDFWTVCILDNPLIMAPIQFTNARLTVYSPNGWHCTYKLETAVNHIIIRGGFDIYTFVLEKEGYPVQTIQVSAKDLVATSKENPFVLKIPWISQLKTIILQPGPEKGKDAMISNLEPDKNFGGHKYFEATFLTEPVLAVMRSNRSLIFFNLDTLPKSAVIKKVILKLSYDLPVPFDSSYLTDTLPSLGNFWYGGVLQQIVEPWEEYKVTWNTQPKTIETNQVYIPPFIRNANFIVVDVTKLFVTADLSAVPNYGMLFRLWPVDKFPGFRFGSSDFAEPGMRPGLIINYTL
jgi:hypothetical protein